MDIMWGITVLASDSRKLQPLNNTHLMGKSRIASLLRTELPASAAHVLRRHSPAGEDSDVAPADSFHGMGHTQAQVNTAIET